MRLTERFARRTVGRMDLEITIDDPGAYTRPIRYLQPQELLPEGELIEYVMQREREAASTLTLAAPDAVNRCRIRYGALCQIGASAAALLCLSTPRPPTVAIPHHGSRSCVPTLLSRHCSRRPSSGREEWHSRPVAGVDCHVRRLPRLERGRWFDDRSPPDQGRRGRRYVRVRSGICRVREKESCDHVDSLWIGRALLRRSSLQRGVVHISLDTGSPSIWAPAIRPWRKDRQPIRGRQSRV
jgi:hypothetical protein